MSEIPSIVEVVATVVSIDGDTESGPYPVTEVFRFEFEDRVKAIAYLRTGLEYSIHEERLGAVPQETE